MEMSTKFLFIIPDRDARLYTCKRLQNKKHLKNVGPIRHNEPPQQMSLAVLSRAACASMSTTNGVDLTGLLGGGT